MFFSKFTLSEKYPDASLEAFVCEHHAQRRPAVIVCPGGGYGMLSPREAEPIVRRFLGEHMNVYLLSYSINEKAADYAPLIEAALAIKLVRERADEDCTDPHKIYILGFSAGGHLAASAGILWNIPEVRDAIGVSSGECPEGINRPDGMILSYPVITGGKFTHKGTLTRFCGTQAPTDADIDRFSLERHVDSTTPPAFIWHTFSDAVVPVQNSLLLMSALAEAKIPFEAHVFPEGPHGISLANTETCIGREDYVNPHVSVWPDLAVKWIRDF